MTAVIENGEASVISQENYAWEGPPSELARKIYSQLRGLPGAHTVKVWPGANADTSGEPAAIWPEPQAEAEPATATGKARARKNAAEEQAAPAE